MSANAEPVEPYLFAYTWRCGDDCCCSEPRVILRMPGKPLGSNVSLWSGSWFSEATGPEMDAQDEELKAAAARYGIALSKDEHGHKEVTLGRARELIKQSAPRPA